MKHFDTIDSLHSWIEKQAKKKIQAYYTDWKNYDRPALMKATGEKATIYIILRKYGSYLYTEKHLLDPAAVWAETVMNYYTDQEDATYYKIDLRNLTAEIIPAGLPKWIKDIREQQKAA
jgi:hypothetical protein